MGSDHTASDQGSGGEELLDDILMEEPMGAALEASVPQVRAIAAASSQPSPQGSAMPASQPGSLQAKEKRAKKPAIDLDTAIRDEAAALNAAQKKEQEAKTQAKHERRRTERLLKKMPDLAMPSSSASATGRTWPWHRDYVPDLAMASSSASATGSAASQLSTSAAASPDAPLSEAMAS